MWQINPGAIVGAENGERRSVSCIISNYDDLLTFTYPQVLGRCSVDDRREVFCFKEKRIREDGSN